MPKWIGLDVHKDYAQAYEWDPETDVKRHFRIPSDQKAWSRFIENQVDRETHIALEATGNAFHVYDILSPHAGKVVVADANHLKRYGDGRHHDRQDAKRLAEMLALGTLRPVWVPPQEIREARRVLKYRDRVVADKTRCINRARAALRGDGHNVPRTMDPWKWLEQHDVSLGAATAAIVQSCRRQREMFDVEIEAMAIELKRFVVRRDRARRVMSLPGIGPIVSAALEAYIGDPNRFEKAKEVVRYAGLDASVHQSGEEYWQGRISKNGPPILRKLLVQAAYQIVRNNKGDLADFYRRKAKDVGGKRAIIALARKLLIAAWRLMQTDRLAYEVKDEATRKAYERTLRSLWREVAKADGVGGTDTATDQFESTRKSGETSSEGDRESTENGVQSGTEGKNLRRSQVPA